MCYALKMNKIPTPANGRTLLWEALETGDLEQLNKALEMGVSPDSAHGKWIPMGKALRRGHLDLALALINAGADLSLMDQSTSLMRIASGRPGLAPALLAMLAKGAKARPGDLRMAARTGNTLAVNALIEAGVDALDPGSQMGRHKTPALAQWPLEHNPPPKKLIEATFSDQLTDEACIEIIRDCTREKNEPLFQLLATRPEVSARARNILLRHCIHSHWDTAVDQLLSTKSCDPVKVHAEDDTLLSAVANLLRHGKNKNASWALLDRLIDYGYHPSASHDEFCIGYGRDHYRAPAPVWLEAIRNGPTAGKKRLIKTLVTKGASLDDRFGENGKPHANGGLIHLLVATNDIATAQWVKRTWKKQEWEPGITPGVIASWAILIKEEYAQEQLKCLLAMGFDVNKCAPNGDTALRWFLNRADPSRVIFDAQRITHKTLHALACTLINHGLRTDATAHDFAFARQIGVPPEMTSEWESLFMRNTTNPNVLTTSTKRPRL